MVLDSLAQLQKCVLKEKKEEAFWKNLRKEIRRHLMII